MEKRRASKDIRQQVEGWKAGEQEQVGETGQTKVVVLLLYHYNSI